MLDQSYYDMLEHVDFRFPKQHIVSIGGGFSSTIELTLEVVRKYGAENTHLVIAALGNEHDDLWRLIAECERLTGLTVKRIIYDAEKGYIENPPKAQYPTIWDIFDSQKMMGNSLADPCSRMLKRETMRTYIAKNFHPKFSVLHVGITRNEIDRMIAIRRNWTKAGYEVEADLCDLELEGESKDRCLKALGWVPELYQRGHKHNNCAGFCVKAGHSEMARLLYYDPDTYYYHAQKEREFQKRNDTKATIMRDRKTVNKKVQSTPLTLYEFADRMKAKWANTLPGWNPFEDLESAPACSWCDSVA